MLAKPLYQVSLQKQKTMDKALLYVDREYIRMETLLSGSNLAVKKTDYDRIVFLTEVYGQSLLIPAKEVVEAVPLVEKKDSVFEMAATGAYFIPMKDLRLTVNKENLSSEN
jgi:hypothetical protein